MRFIDLKLVLRQIGVNTEYLVPRSPTQVQIPCPLAKWLHSSGHDSHPSLSIQFDVHHEWTKFKCWTCKEQGKLWNLVDSYGQLAKDDSVQELALRLLESDKPSISARFGAMEEDLASWVREPATKVMEFSDDTLERFRPAYDNRRASDFLVGRQVTEETSRYWSLRYDEHNDRIVFPVRNAKGKLVGAVGRVVDNEVHPRYYNYLGFNAGRTLGGLHKIPKDTSKVVVVEGFFDILRAYKWAEEVSAAVVCTWRAEMTGKQAELILGMDKLISIWYDLDEAGKKGWSKARGLLEPVTYGLRRATWSDDVDVGAMSKRQFKGIWKTLWGAAYDGRSHET